MQFLHLEGPTGHGMGCRVKFLQISTPETGRASRAVTRSTSKAHRRRCSPLAARAELGRSATTWTPSIDSSSVLVADIGGTNCRFVLCEISGTRLSKTILSKTYQTKEFATFPDALHAFSAAPEFQANTPRAAAFAVAGPVADNRCDMTNLSWTIDGHHLTEKHGIKIAVLNDFEANGYGVPTLTDEDLLVLHDVPPVDKAPKVVMGPGTGLGQANLLWNDAQQRYKVWPSEGAHATFGPRGWKQRALHGFVEQRFGHCETEYLACGSGLELIYEFLCSDEDTHRPHVSHRIFKDAPAITQASLDESDPLACETVDLFMTIVGAEASANALRVLAHGGVYLGGGILPRVQKRLANGALLTAFLHQESRFAKTIQQFPLYLVKDTGLGIRGAIAYAAQLN